MTQVSVADSETMRTSKESVDSAIRAFHRSKEDNQNATEFPLQNARSQLSTATGASSFEDTLEPTLCSAAASLSPFSCTSSGSVSLHCSARFCLQVPAAVVEMFTHDRYTVITIANSYRAA